MLFGTSRIHVGKYLRIILEKVGRPGRATLILGKAHHEETKMLGIKSFLVCTIQLCEKTSCSQDFVFPRLLTLAKIISHIVKDVSNLNSIARP